MTARAIGGYFGLELGASGGWKPTGRGYRSARSALCALLSAVRPTRVWVPSFVCSAVRAAIDGAGIARSEYRLTNVLGVPNSLPLGRDEVLLCVNYFGLSEGEIDRALETYGANKVIVDNAQALFSPPRPCLGAVYSPRKFVGVPDGGYLVAAFDVPSPSATDTASLGRCRHLVLRRAFGAQAGYDAFLQAERSLDDVTPVAMSSLTARLLKGIDYAAVSGRRMANYGRYQQRFADTNLLGVPARLDHAPLCYPLVVPRPGLREHLIAARIFVPNYWPESPFEREGSGGKEYLVSLPLDQRYGAAEIERVAAVVTDFMRTP